ncbi:hypothetical protein IQ264_04040 [Phormidium sp. LEGE 05292]|uniref:hypothetical protein n=1 Tax=[Phormidium] sp. LEGE 05292 TaxID=767427 RepID=UPI0018812CAE|nr:hypothetical protein [Phormidium sp. LEGE 05292]MBE9224641.1 hypothetical protein [Phormidium sp. LEGE 05292]
MTSTSLVKKLRVYYSKLFDKDVVELVFTFILLFMTTCIGSMLMICFFWEMEKRSLPQTETKQSFGLLVPNLQSTKRLS